MQRRGFTLIEILIAAAIVAVLAGIIFTLTRPSREAARQSVCMSQLRQHYLAHQMYAVDNDATGLYPELRGLAYIPSAPSEVMYLYQKNLELQYCPSLPGAMRKGHASSYTWYLMGSPVTRDGRISRERQDMIEKERVLGAKTPVVECQVHDDLFYAPNERHVNPREASPYLIRAHLDGSVKAARVRTPRSTLFSLK